VSPSPPVTMMRLIAGLERAGCYPRPVTADVWIADCPTCRELYAARVPMEIRQQRGAGIVISACTSGHEPPEAAA
jgi:hypothetical protein